MGFDLSVFEDEGFEPEFLDWLVDEKAVDIQSHFSRLWEYYANSIYQPAGSDGVSRKMSESGRCYVQAQEYGLPPRITGLVRTPGADVLRGRPLSDVQRKEVVIENDIAWRINAAVDFLFGKPVDFVSRSPDSRKGSEIEKLLKALFQANGGIGFFQDMAVLGSVYGFVDCLLRPAERISARSSEGGQASLSSLQTPPVSRAEQLVRTIELELIEAPRALPVLEEGDYKKIRYYVQHFYQKKNSVSTRSTFLSRLLRRFSSAGANSGAEPEVVCVTEIISDRQWQRYENRELIAEGELPWGFLPVVHIQNITQPYYYEGISDVEPLMPLQDELNTRLSDRANRITFQSFKMYLGKGIEGFEERPVSPGRMWCTDNPEASIEEFGGDDTNPSEDMHIAEIREAMDKTSGVTPLAAGVLKNKLGNLTSAVALRLTMMGMLSRTERKKFTYGEGLKKICRMVLEMLDKAGVYHTEEADREVDIIFPSPLPENMTEKLKEARIKKELGVPTEQVLRELGYDVTDDR